MRHGLANDDDWQDDEEAWEPDAEDDSEDWVPEEEEEEPTIPCPYCQKPIFEESERCPHCENYISEEDAPPVQKPWWIILGVAACLFAVYLWLSR